MRLQNIGKLFGIVTIALVVAGCGGGGGGTTTPVEPAPPVTPAPDPLPTSFNTTKDLEYTVLDIVDTWRYTGTEMATEIKFTNYYEGDMLVDDTSTSYYARGCSTSENSGFTYLCLGIFSSGMSEAWGIDINSNGIITGRYALSISGDTYELARRIKFESESDATTSGRVWRNTAKTSTGSIANAGGMTLGNMSLAREGELSELKSMSVTSENAPQADAETVQILNNLRNHLIDTN